MRRKEAEPEIASGPKAPHPSPLPPYVRFPALNALLLLVILNFALQPLTEPDFGWHLRTGLDLLKQGGRLPALDPYSHTMPDWPWVEHAWLTDLLIGSLYEGGGAFGALAVILFFGVVTAGAWWMAARSTEVSPTVRLVACSLSLWVALPYLGARTQMVTLLGLATLMWMLHRLGQGAARLVWGIPPLFLLWANLHGGFTAGLFFLALVIGLSWLMSLLSHVWPQAAAWRGKSLHVFPIGRPLVLTTGLGGLLTLVNPYGWRLYKEILDSLSNRFMIEALQEWHSISLDTLAGKMFVTYLVALGLAMACWYRRVEPVRWGIIAVFLVLACRHLRNIPLFLIVSLPLSADLLQEAVSCLARQSLVKRLHPSQWVGGLTLALGLFLLYLGPDHLQHVWRFGVDPAASFRATSYPIEAVEWIRTHRDRLGERPVHDYQYGGFLLWWLPEGKIFIDGRMAAWRSGDRWIFKDYVDVRETDPPQLAVLDKYSIDWALLRRGAALANTLGSLSAWRKEYEDAKVVIYATDRKVAFRQSDYSKTADEEARGESVRATRRSE